MLETNYRTNDTLVIFARDAGYGPALTSHSPDLTLDLIAPIPTDCPDDWTEQIFWTPNWAALLGPAIPAICFVYTDGRSGVSNLFEAEAVAALARLLSGRVSDKLRHQRYAATGAPVPPSGMANDHEGSWTRGVGVVTPHRAQEGPLVARLCEAFPGVDGALIRGAVDTVERFQGQQRDFILASFALGDPDDIAREEEFLFSLRRFYVLASRAHAKLIVLISQEVVDHLSGDADTLRDSRLLKLYADTFCHQLHPLALGHHYDGQVRTVHGVLRTRHSAQ